MNTRQRILLVDDDPDLLDLYREILTQLPARPEVQTANSGPPALALLEAEPFDLLICNLHMPKMNGFEVLEIARRKYPQIRTMMLTGDTDESLKSRAYALGVDLFCNKPGTEEETKLWLEQVGSLLGREGGGNTLAAQPRRTHPPRIVVVDDEPACLEIFKLLIEGWFKEVTLLLFSNSDEAWQELAREGPDLLILDMPLSGLEILPRLAEHKVKYPVLLTSGFDSEEVMRQHADPNLNVSALSKPFLAQQVWRELLIHLGPSDNPDR